MVGSVPDVREPILHHAFQQQEMVLGLADLRTRCSRGMIYAAE